MQFAGLCISIRPTYCRTAKTLYQQYFNFSAPPFSISPDPQFIYMSERHQEGLAHLLYGINQGGGFVALTGEVGTGKTTLCHCLLQQLPENVDIALILNPKLTAVELLATICDELGIAQVGQSAKSLIDAINAYLLAAYAQGRRSVLLIDEAQNLSLEVLEQIRLLTNLETSKAKLLQIILVGQPELNQMLARQELRQLNQRITARYHLGPLSLDETRAYILHRLRVCHGSHRLFQAAAIRKIYRYSAGVPRLINILCDRALLGAYSTDTRRIGPAIIVRAASETLGPRRAAVKRYVAVAATLVLGIAAGFHAWRMDRPILPTAKPVAVSEAAVVAPPVEAKPLAPAFQEWLDAAASVQEVAFAELLRIWRQKPATDKPVNCDTIASLGLSCLSGKGGWQELIRLDRPALLAFSDTRGQKRYLSLTGADQRRAVAQINGDREFPLVELLTLWDGNYLLLWRPPRPGLTEIAPPQKSADVEWLRGQIGKAAEVPAGGDPRLFDDALKTQLMAFQRQQQLTPDGIAGARTLIQLQNRSGAEDSPHLDINHR